MTPKQWQQVRETYEAIAQATPERQAAALTELGMGNAEVCAQVERLLEVSQQAQDFLETPPFIEPAWLQQAFTDEAAIGRRLGPYRIVREIGQGGMSTVYL